MTKEKQNSSESKHELQIISFSAALGQSHTNPEQPWAPGAFTVPLSHKHAVLQNNPQPPAHQTNEAVPRRMYWVLTSNALSEITVFPLKIDKLK